VAAARVMATALCRGLVMALAMVRVLGWVMAMETGQG
jgi:hypothetical protein